MNDTQSTQPSTKLFRAWKQFTSCPSLASLPDKIGYAPVVQYEGSFLIVGGNNDTTFPRDAVIRYNAKEEEWETLPMTLATARYRHTALAVTAC